MTRTDSIIRYTQNINNSYIENARKQQYEKVMSSSQNSEGQLYPILTLLIFNKNLYSEIQTAFSIKK